MVQIWIYSNRFGCQREKTFQLGNILQFSRFPNLFEYIQICTIPLHCLFHKLRVLLIPSHDKMLPYFSDILSIPDSRHTLNHVKNTRRKRYIKLLLEEMALMFF